MQEPKLNTMSVTRTAHYYTIGNTNDPQNIWIALHGYGQLASRIVRKFDHLDLNANLIIAPEGLSKFYYSRQPEILGATWMTKHQRLDEIKDYLNYLDQIHNYIEQTFKNYKLNILGFSQGSSTMWRWITHSQATLNAVITWAGEYPPEPDYVGLNDYLNTITNNIFCYGSEDEFLTEKRIKGLVQKIDETKMNIEIKKFEGKHVIKRDLLQLIAEQIA